MVKRVDSKSLLRHKLSMKSSLFVGLFQFPRPVQWRIGKKRRIMRWQFIRLGKKQEKNSELCIPLTKESGQAPRYQDNEAQATIHQKKTDIEEGQIFFFVSNGVELSNYYGIQSGGYRGFIFGDFFDAFSFLDRPSSKSIPQEGCWIFNYIDQRTFYLPFRNNQVRHSFEQKGKSNVRDVIQANWDRSLKTKSKFDFFIRKVLRKSKKECTRCITLRRRTLPIMIVIVHENFSLIPMRFAITANNATTMLDA